MKQIVTVKGVPEVIDVPSPAVESGYIIVQAAFSCISIGTEIHGMKVSSKPLWKRAVADPQKALNFVKKSMSNGVSKTVDLIEDKLSSPVAVGYSSAGIVIAIGADIDDIEIGDRVACAGSQGAFHAEQIMVSRNLAVKVPDGVCLKHASTVALGAIALQGVRRLNPSIGETITVLGLGVLGQITIQILKACGCKVIAIDLEQDRLDIAVTVGADEVLNPSMVNDVENVKLLTNYHGVDAVIVAASSPSDHIVSSAFNMCRKKGKVVLVGDVGLNLNRADFYAKELDFLISSSYGPGRYDNQYEEKNIDYPLPFVRWTENRNMAEFLNLIEQNKVKISPLISKTYKVDEAKNAYDDIVNQRPRPLVALIEYEATLGQIDKVILNSAVKSANNSAKKSKVNISIAGVGSFARAVHLPNIKSLKQHYSVRGIMNRSPHNAQAVMRQYQAAFSTSNFDELLEDADSDTVLISTRHDSHLDMTLAALKKGKNVLVEKPLCLTEAGLEEIKEFYSDGEVEGHAEYKVDKPILMVAYNRRFAPQIVKIKAILEKSKQPIIINYVMNAGYIPKESWIHGKEGGGRNLGEACHIYDLFNYLVGSDYESTIVHRIPSADNASSDNFCVSIKYKNGGIANLTYTSMGSSLYPKETMSIFVEGKTLILNDYSELIIHDGKKIVESIPQDKGHRTELSLFADGVLNGYWPIPLDEILLASRISFDVEKKLRCSHEDRQC